MTWEIAIVLIIGLIVFGAFVFFIKSRFDQGVGSKTGWWGWIIAIIIAILIAVIRTWWKQGW
ncbi:MAG: twin-arginine translocase TatA/TatE family subunit [Paludibacteraceae bacterium]|nr:twin-arginine translocase TatA/TatE family subunit [Paludibacteraceae bacterium]